MASADKPHVAQKARATTAETAIDFLPDADEIERRPLPLLARFTLHFLVLAMVAFFVWASLSKVDLIVTARGKLVTPLPNIVVQPLETSMVQSIDVHIGQVVHKGDVLATLDPTFVQADESELKGRLQSLNTQWASLDAELSGARVEQAGADTVDSKIQSALSSERQANHLSQQRSQNESIGKLQSELETSRRDQAAQEERVKGLMEMEKMTDDLVNKKLAVRSRLLDVRDRLLEGQRAVEMAQNHQVEIRRELAALQAQKSASEAAWRQKLLEDLLQVTRERDSVNDQLQKAMRRQTLVTLTAPADAVVLDIAKLSRGSIARGAETFFTLVPLGEVLEAEVEIDTQDIGYVKMGDHADIKVDAFPFQKHGTLKGTLRTVSQDTFRREVQSPNASATYYSGRINLGQSHLDALPPNTTLLPGMTLAAELVVGKRSVMSYLLWPLTKATKEAIREP